MSLLETLAAVGLLVVPLAMLHATRPRSAAPVGHHRRGRVHTARTAFDLRIQPAQPGRRLYP